MNSGEKGEDVTDERDPMQDWFDEVVIGDVEQRPIVILDYDPAWPERFEREREKVIHALGGAALGGAALAVEHIGSTSVPGLAAKPIVDMLLVVADSSDEGSYLPALEGAGYVLRVREPDFDEHRMFRTPERDVHLHVFTEGSVEIERYLLLRERLRHHPGERELYERTKRDLSEREWPSMNHYAVAKTEVVEGIIARAAAERRDDPASYLRRDV